MDTLRAIQTCKMPKIRMKKPPQKRKLSPVKEEVLQKKLKSSKPLAASSLHNSKQNSKDCKDKAFFDAESGENKEPPMKKTTTAKKTKLAPAILDSLFAKNSVDRTIECVVRTASVAKCKNVKSCAVKKSANAKIGLVKGKTECEVFGASKRKTRNSNNNVVVMQAVPRVPRKSLVYPRWSNGWVWEGESFESKVFINVSIFFVIGIFFVSYLNISLLCVFE